MPETDALDERMRSVASKAIKAAAEPATAADHSIPETHRIAVETTERLREMYEIVGASVNLISVITTSGDTAIRSDVTMSQVAAEKLSGELTATQQRRNQAAMLRVWQARNRMAHAKSKYESGSPITRGGIAGFCNQLRDFTLPDWMQWVLRLDRDDKSDGALDELFDRIDPMLSSREFDKVNDILAAMPVEGPSLTLMMGLLSITRPAGAHLPSRAPFFARVYRLCKAMRRDAESLLGGLR
jgi:hypothetical protein